MIRTILVLASLAAVTLPASAQPIGENPPTKTIQCIEVGGRLIPAVCKVPGSRLDLREDICTCPDGGQRVEVAICRKGQTPPPEGRTLNRARATAARDGTLVGDTVDGRPICVALRRP